MSAQSENGFLKFIKSLRPFEWAIIVVILFFLGIFVWGFSQPKVTPEIKTINPETKVRLYGVKAVHTVPLPLHFYKK